MIAYDVQFTAAERAARRRQRADRGGAGRARRRSSWPRPPSTRRQDADLRRRRRAEYSRAVPAFSSFEKDADGIQRRLLDSENGLDAFPIAAAQIKLGPQDRRRRPSSGDWIDFEGGPETVPAPQLHRRRSTGNFDPEDVRGKVVVVGATATALQDIRETSTTNQRAMAGPEVHANAITTALDGFPLQSAPTWIDILVIVALGVVRPADRHPRFGCSSPSRWRSSPRRARRRRPDRLRGRRDRQRRLRGGRRGRRPARSPPPSTASPSPSSAPTRARRSRASSRSRSSTRSCAAPTACAWAASARGDGHVQRPPRLHVASPRRSSRPR